MVVQGTKVKFDAISFALFKSSSICTSSIHPVSFGTINNLPGAFIFAFSLKLLGITK
jgi:hypothetical protein